MSIAASAISAFDPQHRPNGPLRMPGALRDWPALAQWSPQYLRAMTVDHRVAVRVSRSGAFRYRETGEPSDPAQQNEVPDVSWHQAIDWITCEDPDAPKYYVAQLDIRQSLPRLLEDLRFPRGVTSLSPTLWFGSRGVSSQLHFDRGDNLYCQVYGAKEFTLFCPDDSKFLYQYPDACTLSHVSYVDAEKPDLRLHPLYKCAAPLAVRLEPGDVLFLPAYWWHYVTSPTVSISVNQWWQEEVHQRFTANAIGALRADYTLYRSDPGRFPRHETARHWLQTASAMASANPVAAVLVAACALTVLEHDGKGTDDALREHVATTKWKRVLVRALTSRRRLSDAAFARDVQLCVSEIHAAVSAAGAEVRQGV